MSAALAPPNPPACTLILICRNCEAFLLSAACTIPIWDRQSKPAASLVTAAEFISAVHDHGSLELSMLRPRAMDMSESIRKNRQVVLISKAHSHTGGDVVGGIIGASEFTIVVSVHGNTVIK
jgi:hypothetical protein